MSHFGNQKQQSQDKSLFDFVVVETFGGCFILFVISYRCKMDAACYKTREIFKSAQISFKGISMGHKNVYSQFCRETKAF